CNEILGNEYNNMFLEHFGKYIEEYNLENRIIFETENFCVLPSIGPLVEGHLLILTKEHYLSYAHIPQSKYRELKQVKYSTSKLLQRVYHSPVFFEHGPMSEVLKGGTCCDHAHLHAVPVDIEINIKEELQKFNFIPRDIKDLEELRDNKERLVPYLFFEDSQGEKIVCDAPMVETQFIRKLLAVKIGSKNVFWRYNLNIELVVAALRKLRATSEGWKEEGNNFPLLSGNTNFLYEQEMGMI
ncbi:MAG: hypothetical protein H8D45_01785, partial [Bacteroidetes bacterium]|nr:hypothetical protein [Bacteroidota bacterium]